MIKMDKKWMVALLALALPVTSLAAAQAWKIVPNDSSLTFVATQNGAPVTGSFKNFTGDINFDPKQLATSNVDIVVDTSSMTDPYNQLADTLKSADWFNVKMYPQAVFKSTTMTQMGDKTFEMKGTLTLRDKTLPVTLIFTEKEYSATKAHMTGSTTIQRTAFGIGQGEWADVKTIKDDVQINFDVVALKK